MKRGELLLLGTRGSNPVANASCLRYGGNTIALALPLDTTTLVVDGGTGVVDFGRELAADETAPSRIDMLFTHFHHDHVCGLLSFVPLYLPRFEVVIHLERAKLDTGERALKTLFGLPFRPVVWDDLQADITFRELPREAAFDGVRVARHPLDHPGGSTAYRFEGDAGSVVLATDYEQPAGETDARLVDFCRGAGAILYDSHFAPGELAAHRGWGHSTWEMGSRLRAAAGAARLVMIHHAPGRDDAGVEALEAEARRADGAIAAGREGMRFPVAPGGKGG